MKTPSDDAHARCVLLKWCLKGEPAHEHIDEHAAVCAVMSVAVMRGRADGVAVLAAFVEDRGDDYKLDSLTQLAADRLGVSQHQLADAVDAAESAK